MKNIYKVILSLSMLWLGSQSAVAQKFMGIGTEKPNPRAVLELKVEDPTGYQQGFLPPKLSTTERIAFGTVLSSTTLTGMTVYDTDVNAFFVWTGSWTQLASSAPVNISATGINGALVTTSGIGFTIDGLNFVQKVQNLLTGDIKGNYNTGFTVSGLNSIPINYPSITVGDYLQFDGTSIIGFNPGITPNTSIVGVNGIVVNQTGQGFTINGANLLANTSAAFGTDLTGAYGALSVTGIQGYAIIGVPSTGNVLSFNGTNFEYVTPAQSSATTVNGIGGIVAVPSANSYTVSVSGLNLLAQSFPNAIGTAFSGTIATNSPLFKAPITLPYGVRKVRVTLNAYQTSVGNTSTIRINIGAPINENIDLTLNGAGTDFETFTISNSNTTNFLIGVTNQQTLVRVYATTNDAVYLQGIQIEVLE
ncbi:MAG: hypothetical protein ACKVOU_01635 [Cytophagales bacterium]